MSVTHNNSAAKEAIFVGSNIGVSLAVSGIAELAFDVADSAVNIFNGQTVDELEAALLVLESTPAIKGLLIMSGKDSFIAGADIKEFGAVFSKGPDAIRILLDRSNKNFNRIESLPFPVVAVINGFALGGGCEITLTCDYRLASTQGRIGLPETRLGIIPGWGGTVRLPRIAGVETAVEWITTGKEYKALSALECGVLDGVVEPECLYESAHNLLMRCVDGSLDYQQRRKQKQQPLLHNAIERMMAFTTCKAVVSAQAGCHYPAPLAAVVAMERAATLVRDDALAIETDTFIAMAQTSTAASLSGIFVNDQYLSKKAKAFARLCPQKKLKSAVIGAGIMGGGIAYQSALKHIPVKMKDIYQEGIDIGLAEVNKLLVKRVDRGRLSSREMGETLNRIEPVLSYDGFDVVDIVVEAVVENPKVKQAVLAEAEAAMSKEAVLASNTSTISISRLANALERPENFCGMHFFNPVHAMPLVEVIRGEKTSDYAIAATVAYANSMGKKVVVVNDCPGFLVNRVLFPYFAGFAMLIRDGADFQQIDRVMEAWGWPMGPAYLMDVVGIDTGIHAEGVMAEGFSRLERNFISAMDVLHEKGRLGQKSGSGFYRYELDKKGKLQKLNDSDVFEFIKPHQQSRLSESVFSDEDIIARMMIPMVTELVRCLEERVVGSVAEADMALVYGIGFPSFRGGVFRWIDQQGLTVFCNLAERYTHLGELYQIPSSMVQLHADGGHYYAVEEL